MILQDEATFQIASQSKLKRRNTPFLSLDLWTSLFKYFKIIAIRLFMAWSLLVGNFFKRILGPNINHTTKFDDSESPGFRKLVINW